MVRQITLDMPYNLQNHAYSEGLTCHWLQVYLQGSNPDEWDLKQCVVKYFHHN